MLWHLFGLPLARLFPSIGCSAVTAPCAVPLCGKGEAQTCLPLCCLMFAFGMCMELRYICCIQHLRLPQAMMIYSCNLILGVSYFSSGQLGMCLT